MRRHAEIELGHSVYTDNDGLSEKIHLRKLATKGLGSLRVLDLFAGENKIWKAFDCERYYGIEAEKGKGRNLHADNRNIIPVLDLSQFNVIDCDAYGTPYDQVSLLFGNPTLASGTVVIYTCITGTLNRLSVKMLEDYRLTEQYKRSRVLYNPYAHDMFHDLLYRNGIRRIWCYRKKQSMNKEYGYFMI